MEEILKMSFRNLSHHKARTGLTLLGIIIGIAAVVALISLSSGLNESVRDQLEALGGDKIIIAPRQSQTFGAGPPSSGVALSEKELDAVERIRDVEIAIPLVFKSFPVSVGDESTLATVYGMPLKDMDAFLTDVQRYELEEGRNLERGDKSSTVIGSRLSKDTFEKDINVRDKIKVAGKDIRVVGIIEETGNQQDDNAIVLDIETVRELSGSDDEISVIFVKARGDVKKVAQEIENDLEDLHNEKLFVAITTEQLIEQINSVFGVMSLVLVGIAGISLLVAGVGILNTMLMSVIERTREIGIMKAIGATNKKILALFLSEAAMVGFIGGIVGVVLGYAISFSFSSAAVSFVGMQLLIPIDPVLITGALAFSTAVGVISGTYPAYRAAKLDPVEALRYE